MTLPRTSAQTVGVMSAIVTCATSETSPDADIEHAETRDLKLLLHEGARGGIETGKDEEQRCHRQNDRQLRIMEEMCDRHGKQHAQRGKDKPAQRLQGPGGVVE